MKKRILAVVITVLIILTMTTPAFAEDSGQAQSDTPQVTDTPLPIETVTDSPAPTTTETAEPTETPQEPTVTPEPTVSLTPTQSPVDTAEPMPTETADMGIESLGGYIQAMGEDTPDFEYAKNSDNITVTITKYKGTNKSVTVPDEIDGYKVTVIGGGAFYNNTTITNVILPDSILSIGDGAFFGCTNLASIQISDGLKTIGSDCFYQCTSLSSITLPSTTTAIDEYSFFQCTSLSSAIMPGIKSIGDYAFNRCNNLSSLELSDCLVSLGNVAFGSCIKISNVDLPNTLNNIGDSVFSYCTGITIVNFTEGLTTIGSRMFMGCSGITSLVIPDSVTTIGDKAFAGTCINTISLPENLTSVGIGVFNDCINLGSININESNTSFQTINGVLYNKASTMIIQYPEGKTDVTEYDIPSSVTQICGFAFYKCTVLLTINLPNGLSSIGESAFQGCSNILNILIPDGITELKDSTFQSCTNLVNITFPNGLIHLGKCVFGGCKSIREIDLPNNIISIGDSVFANCTKLENINLPDSLTSMGNDVFYDDSSLKSINIPVHINSVNDSTFHGCSNLSNVVLPEGITAIEDYAFDMCHNLTNINFPEGLKTIGSAAFQQCYRLSTVELPEGLTSLGTWAFAACAGLTDINIPEGITSIPGYTFYACRSLTSINLPLSLKRIGFNAFQESGLVSIVLPNNVTSIDYYAFEYCNDLVSVSLPDTVSYIGQEAFGDCPKLRSINIPKNLKKIQYYCFVGCDNLTSIILPTSVITIEEGVFKGSGLCSIYIPENVTSISDNSFYGDPSEYNEDLIIYGKEGSYAQSYAGSHNITFIAVSDFIPVSNIEITDFMDNIIVGESYSFVATVYPANSTDKRILWESDDAAIASVDNTGQVTGIGPGNTKIKASAMGGGAEDSRNVIIDPVHVTRVTLNHKQATLMEGDSLALTAAVLPVNASYPTVSWSSSDSSIVMVSTEGLVYAGNTGEAVVTAIADGVSDTCTISVVPLQYTVTFDTQEGSHIEPVTVNYGYPISAPVEPTKQGYAFSGWYTTSSCDNEEVIFPVNVIKNVTLYAKWVVNGTSGGYNFTLDKGQATITGYTGSGGTVNVPSSLNGYPIKFIGNSAFRNKSNITSVVIPGGITKIGDSAFSGCFYLKTVSIGKGVTSIGVDAFSNCNYLHDITIPDSVTSIGRNAFNKCVWLEKIVIPGSVKTIEQSTFYDCNGLKTVEISGGVTTIESLAFYFCERLTNITIPDSVTSISTGAFNRCTSLGRAYFKGNAPSMGGIISDGSSVFGDCASYFTVYYLSGSTGFSSPWYGYPTAVYDPTHTYKVHFNTNGSDSGPPPTDQKVYWGQKAIKPPVDPDLNGYTFAGWGVNRSKPVDTWDFNTNQVTGDITLYALWKPNSAPIITDIFSTGYNYIWLTWNGVPKAKGYQVYRSTKEDGKYTKVKSTNRLSFDDFNVEPGITYYYKVRSYTSSGSYSGFSELAQMETKLREVYSAKAVMYNPTSIKVSWKTVEGRSGYEVERLNSASGLYELLGTTKNTYYKDKGLITNTQYSYRVRAYRLVNGQKVYGGYSKVVSDTPELHKVTGLKTALSSPTKIKLTWSSVEGGSGYEIERSLTADGTYTAIGNTNKAYYYDSGIEPNKTYYYKVRAYITLGSNNYYGAESTVKSATPKFGSVTKASASSSSSTSIKLTWGAVSGSSGYEIERSLSSESGFTYVGSTAKAYYYDKSLITKTEYYYRMHAYVMIGDVKFYTEYSPIKSAIPR